MNIFLPPSFFAFGAGPGSRVEARLARTLGWTAPSRELILTTAASVAAVKANALILLTNPRGRSLESLGSLLVSGAVDVANSFTGTLTARNATFAYLLAAVEDYTEGTPCVFVDAAFSRDTARRAARAVLPAGSVILAVNPILGPSGADLYALCRAAGLAAGLPVIASGEPF